MTFINDDETLGIYIEESKEHLETIETDLLEIERQGEDIDEELVNRVFRAAHSMKGGASFLGLDTIKELSHKIENVLQMIRSFQLAPNQQIVNIVLAAFDGLGNLLDQPAESNNVDISQHVNALEKIVTGTLDEDEKKSLHDETEIKHPDLQTIFFLKEYDLIQAKKGGKNIYIAIFDLIGDIERKTKTPLGAIKIFEDIGIILDIKVDILSVGDLDSDDFGKQLPMHVLFTSIIESDLIGTLLGVDDQNILTISDEMTTKSEDEPQQHSLSDKLMESAPAMEDPVIPEKVENNEYAEPKATEPKVASAPKPKSPQNSTKAKFSEIKTESLRVSVSILDQLMNRASELVLARNQLLQALSSWDKQALTNAGQRIDLVTSELQETTMLTRMQPIGIIFNKFPRIVRDLAQNLGKKIELEMEGKDVELDKTIIEGLGDPLTHLVRNSIDHGVEMPDIRQSKGKNNTGKINLKAYYESGQVVIEISDDGNGIDSTFISEKAISKGLLTAEQVQGMSEKEKLELIMLPGFSTAEEVTDISGRGVGMDVVKTNLDNMGGKIELLSEMGKGTITRIKLPLTLAIIPSLLVSSSDERFAFPQVNISELLRIPANEVREKIEKIGDADVLLLRGELIPLLQLNNILDLKKTYYDVKEGVITEDRRDGIVDSRLDGKVSLNSTRQVVLGEEINADQYADTGQLVERRSRRESDVIIVVLNEGTFKYGLVVDEVFDTVEIVVKPLGRHFNKTQVYSGATIMGDGHVALILDVPGIAQKVELRAIVDSGRSHEASEDEKSGLEHGVSRQVLLMFNNGTDERCGVSLHQVLRVEKIHASDIEIHGGKKVIQYRGGNLPVYALEEVANVEMLEERDDLIVIIFSVSGHEVGLLAVQPLDVREVNILLDENTLRQTGISGSTIIDEETVLMIDIFEIIQFLNPQWFDDRPPVKKLGKQEEIEQIEKSDNTPRILLVEDSRFFRDQVRSFIENEGYEVVEAEDGQIALDYLDQNPDTISLVVTDLEMPNMDGFELTRNIKADDRFSHLSVIALTSLAGEENLEKGNEVGIDDYQIKIDKEQLLNGIFKYLNKQN